MRLLSALFLGIPLSAQAVEMDAAPPPAESAHTFSYEMDVPNPQEGRAIIAEEPDVVDLETNALIEQLVAEQSLLHSDIETAAMFEARYPETDRFYLEELARIAQTVEGGQAAPEYYARTGRPEWTPYHRALFSEMPVEERMAELHPEYRGLTGDQFVDAYPEMLKLARTEFRFSNQARFLTDDAIQIFSDRVADLPPEDALIRYNALFTTIGKDVGLAPAIRLTDESLARLPAGHPIALRASELGIDDVRSLVGKSKENIVHMDQAAGEIRVMRKVGDLFLILDTFPAIGGKLATPELDVTGPAVSSEFVHVPDMVLRATTPDRAKTSWSWHNSWVPNGAPIREHGSELQYQHPSTRQWYDLTGPNAAFFPDRDGNVLRPFDKKVEPMDIGLIRAASHRSPDGSTSYVPKAWTRDDILKKNGGELPEAWEFNDFGSTAVRLQTTAGEKTNINVHSQPNVDVSDFLPNRTHGCFATYGEYIKNLTDTYGLGNGTTVVVTTKGTYSLSNLLK